MNQTYIIWWEIMEIL